MVRVNCLFNTPSDFFTQIVDIVEEHLFFCHGNNK